MIAVYINQKQLTAEEVAFLCTTLLEFFNDQSQIINSLKPKDESVVFRTYRVLAFALVRALENEIPMHELAMHYTSSGSWPDEPQVTVGSIDLGSNYGLVIRLALCMPTAVGKLFGTENSRNFFNKFLRKETLQ